MPVVEPKLRYDHLRQLPEDGRRYELAEGVLWASSPPRERHQRVVARLVAWLDGLGRAGLGRVYPAPFDVVLSEETVFQPDVLFVREEHRGVVTEENVQGPPDLVVEVLSEATRECDLGLKLRLYAHYGVPETWIVDPDGRSVRIFRRGPEGRYVEETTVRPGQALTSPLLGDARFPVEELFDGGAGLA
ncbi:MAG: Uma2 family endonuclease [Firmicutes bacterium]|nr:Uma2 family endonuclease [Bacillota bacterium]